MEAILTLDLNTAVIYGTAVLTMFATTFLRGFQNKNVAGGYRKLAGIFGYAMAVCDMLTVGLIVKGGMSVAFIGAFGAALGWIVGMVVHDAILRKRQKEAARLKKEKKRSKREQYILSLIEERLSERALENRINYEA